MSEVKQVFCLQFVFSADVMAHQSLLHLQRQSRQDGEVLSDPVSGRFESLSSELAKY